MSRTVVAIDGPAGAGKSTVARSAAQRLGLPHIDTGAIYRALTLRALRAGIAAGDAEGLSELALETRIEFHGDKVVVDGEDVTAEIRAPEVTACVSQVSSYPAVREKMVALQRSLVTEKGAVVEGRDIGTVVAPGATLKIFLTADPQERARRRAAELSADEVEAVMDQMMERDRSDSQRRASPLAVAEDAVVIDSTGRTVESIVDEIERLVNERAR